MVDVDVAPGAVVPSSVPSSPVAAPVSPSPVRPADSTTTVVREETTQSNLQGVRSWISVQLRNIVILSLVVIVAYMAVVQANESAATAVVGAFSALAGFVFGERAALKKPGTDN